MKRPFGAVFTFQYLLASKLEINSLTNFSRIEEEVFRCASWYDLYPEPFNLVLINLMVPSNGPWIRSWSPGNVSSGFSKLFTVNFMFLRSRHHNFSPIFFKFAINIPFWNILGKIDGQGFEITGCFKSPIGYSCLILSLVWHSAIASIIILCFNLK